MNILKIKQAADIAKARTNDKSWHNAIDKAVAGVELGKWIVTELGECICVTTDSENTYFANGVCQCQAYKRSIACKHRALYRLIEISYTIKEETAPVQPVSSRAALIAEIEAAWPKTWPPLAVELMARFGCNSLKFLDDDMLRRVRLAIAM